MSSSNDSYPEPEGWGKDGFWADSGIDAEYETRLTGAVRPDAGPPEDPGYSYWSDGKGWEVSPGANAGDATQLDSARAAFPGGAPGDPTRMDPRGPGYPGGPAYPGGPGGPAFPGGPDATAYYGAGGPGFPGQGPGGGPGGPGAPGGGPGGRGPGQPGGPGGRNGKRKGSWWRRWTWKKVLALAGGAFLVLILAMGGAYYYLSSSATIPAALANALAQSSTVYYSDGTTVLGTISTEDRHDLTINQIPKGLQDAVIAAEDRGFWTEGGISPTGILRAAYDDVTSSEIGRAHV